MYHSVYSLKGLVINPVKSLYLTHHIVILAATLKWSKRLWTGLEHAVYVPIQASRPQFSRWSASAWWLNLGDPQKSLIQGWEKFQPLWFEVEGLKILRSDHFEPFEDSLSLSISALSAGFRDCLHFLLICYHPVESKTKSNYLEASPFAGKRIVLVLYSNEVITTLCLVSCSLTTVHGTDKRTAVELCK